MACNRAALLVESYHSPRTSNSVPKTTSANRTLLPISHTSSINALAVVLATAKRVVLLPVMFTSLDILLELSNTITTSAFSGEFFPSMPSVSSHCSVTFVSLAAFVKLTEPSAGHAGCPAVSGLSAGAATSPAASATAGNVEASISTVSKTDSIRLHLDWHIACPPFVL